MYSDDDISLPSQALLENSSTQEQEKKKTLPVIWKAERILTMCLELCCILQSTDSPLIDQSTDVY
jgi:hypothetical protein